MLFNTKLYRLVTWKKKTNSAKIKIMLFGHPLFAAHYRGGRAAQQKRALSSRDKQKITNFCRIVHSIHSQWRSLITWICQSWDRRLQDHLISWYYKHTTTSSHPTRTWKNHNWNHGRSIAMACFVFWRLCTCCWLLSFCWTFLRFKCSPQG